MTVGNTLYHFLARKRFCFLSSIVHRARSEMDFQRKLFSAASYGRKLIGHNQLAGIINM